jgi:hypothetical protein
MVRVRPVVSRANLSAPSIASAPELARKMWCRWGGSTLGQFLRKARAHVVVEKVGAGDQRLRLLRRWPGSARGDSGRAWPRPAPRSCPDSGGRRCRQPAAFAPGDHRVVAPCGGAAEVGFFELGEGEIKRCAVQGHLWFLVLSSILLESAKRSLQLLAACLRLPTLRYSGRGWRAVRRESRTRSSHHPVQSGQKRWGRACQQ